MKIVVVVVVIVGVASLQLTPGYWAARWDWREDDAGNDPNLYLEHWLSD